MVTLFIRLHQQEINVIASRPTTQTKPKVKTKMPALDCYEPVWGYITNHDHWSCYYRRRYGNAYPFASI